MTFWRDEYWVGARLPPHDLSRVSPASVEPGAEPLPLYGRTPASLDELKQLRYESQHGSSLRVVSINHNHNELTLQVNVVY